MYQNDHTYNEDDAVKTLESKTSWEELPALLCSVRSVNGMKKGADDLQRELAVAHPSMLGPMTNLWLLTRVHPDDAYHMMPLAAQNDYWNDRSGQEE